MFDVAAGLMDPLERSQGQLAAAASRTALAGTTFSRERSDALMAQSARASIFAQAVLEAVHARLSEVKGATHG